MSAVMNVGGTEVSAESVPPAGAELEAQVRSVAGAAAGVGTLDVLLAGVARLRELPAETVVDLMEALERHASAILALQMQVFVELARPGRVGDPSVLAGRIGRGPVAVDAESEAATLEAAQRLAAAEVAARLNIAHVTARNRLDLALGFASGHRRGFWDQLRAGELDRGRAYLVQEELAGLTAGQQEWVDAAVAPQVPGRTSAELRTLIRRCILAMDPEAAERRAEEALKRRRVRVHPEPDGMASLHAFLPAHVALESMSYLDTCSPRFGPDDVRSADERRADTFAAIFGQLSRYGSVSTASLLARGAQDPIGAPVDAAAATGGSAPVAAQVTVDWDTLRGLASDAGFLSGYGPVTAGQARALVASARSLQVLLVDEATGRPLGAGPPRRVRRHHAGAAGVRRGPVGLSLVRDRVAGMSARGAAPPTGAPAGDRVAPTTDGEAGPAPSALRYRPTAQLRQLVNAIWTHCAFPRCRQPAVSSDLDHREPFDHADPASGGRTVVQNLQPLCRAHHRLKTFTAWSSRVAADGAILWTSPTGHGYRVLPEAVAAPALWAELDRTGCQAAVPPDAGLQSGLSWGEAPGVGGEQSQVEEPGSRSGRERPDVAGGSPVPGEAGWPAEPDF